MANKGTTAGAAGSVSTYPSSPAVDDELAKLKRDAGL